MTLIKTLSVVILYILAIHSFTRLMTDNKVRMFNILEMFVSVMGFAIITFL